MTLAGASGNAAQLSAAAVATGAVHSVREDRPVARLAGRYGVGEDEVDGLLPSGTLVDLYPVRKSIRVGAKSFSLKALEPLYMDAAAPEFGHARRNFEHVQTPARNSRSQHHQKTRYEPERY